MLVIDQINLESFEWEEERHARPILETCQPPGQFTGANFFLQMSQSKVSGFIRITDSTSPFRGSHMILIRIDLVGLTLTISLIRFQAK